MEEAAPDPAGIAGDILSTIVTLMAKGNSEEKVYELLTPGTPREIDLRPAIQRVARWQRCFLDYMRHGWLDSPVPPDIRITAQKYFDGSKEEMDTALRFLPFWVKESHAREIVADFTDVLVRKGATEELLRGARERLQSFPEPVASIALAIWNSPEQVAFREQLRASSPHVGGCAGVLLAFVASALCCSLALLWSSSY